MLTYPLHGADLGITQESIDAGKVNVVYNYKDLLSMVNTAFFSGFIVAVCDSKEEFESIDVMDRILMCSAAAVKLAKLQGRDEDAKNMVDFLEKTLSEDKERGMSTDFLERLYWALTDEEQHQKTGLDLGELYERTPAVKRRITPLRSGWPTSSSRTPPRLRSWTTATWHPAGPTSSRALSTVSAWA